MFAHRREDIGVDAGRRRQPQLFDGARDVQQAIVANVRYQHPRRVPQQRLFVERTSEFAPDARHETDPPSRAEDALVVPTERATKSPDRYRGCEMSGERPDRGVDLSARGFQGWPSEDEQAAALVARHERESERVDDARLWWKRHKCAAVVGQRRYWMVELAHDDPPLAVGAERDCDRRLAVLYRRDRKRSRAEHDECDGFVPHEQVLDAASAGCSLYAERPQFECRPPYANAAVGAQIICDRGEPIRARAQDRGAVARRRGAVGGDHAHAGTVEGDRLSGQRCPRGARLRRLYRLAIGAEVLAGADVALD